jgi:hypothetical protein
MGEYLLTPSTSINVGYVGHHATHLVTPVEGNQPLPGVGDPSTWLPLQQRRPLYATAPLITNISTTASRGRSNYNGMQVSVRQRAVRGFEYLASYTLSKTLTNNLGYYGSGGVAAEGAYWMNAYEPEWNYGPSFFDVRHNFVFSANYELPFGQGRRWGTDASPVVDAVLGGWRLSGILQLRSGFPITVVDGQAPSLQGVRGNERPNCVGDPEPADQSLTHWLDINAFSRAPRGTWGNCPIGVARAPGYDNVDAVLAKQFKAGGPGTSNSGPKHSISSTIRALVRRRATSTRRTRSARSRARSARRGPWSWCSNFSSSARTKNRRSSKKRRSAPRGVLRAASLRANEHSERVGGPAGRSPSGSRSED